MLFGGQHTIPSRAPASPWGADPPPAAPSARGARWPTHAASTPQPLSGAFWNATLAGVWLIFLFGYYHFYVAVILVTGLRSMRAKLTAVSIIYAVPAALNVVGLGLLGWCY